jgi:hypothetical protein
MYETILLVVIFGLVVWVCRLQEELEQARRHLGGYPRVNPLEPPAGSGSLGAE